MKTPTVADVILQTKMTLPQVVGQREAAPDIPSLGSFATPSMSAEPVPRSFIPADLDLSDLKAPEPDGASALLSSKMTLPRFEREQTVAEQILSTKIDVPNLVPETLPRSYIPADVDLSVEPVSNEPTVADQLLKTRFTPPSMVRPETVAERVLSTKMVLPGGSFAHAAALASPEPEKRQARSMEREL